MSGAARGVARLTTTDILRRFDFWTIALAVGVVFADTGILLSNRMPYATGQGLAVSEAVGLVSTVAMAAVLGTLLFGAVADRVDLRLGLANGLSRKRLAKGLGVDESTVFRWESGRGSPGSRLLARLQTAFTAEA